MFSALCLLSGALLAQAPGEAAPPAAPPADAVKLGDPADGAAPVPAKADVGAAEADAEWEIQSDPKKTPAAEPYCIFSRPLFADRHALSFVLGTGQGRFNMIDWEDGPNIDRFWMLGRWAAPDDVQIYANIGFNVHWWAGPVSTPAARAPDLPAHVFDLYLDGGWSQRWSAELATQVRIRPGLYTDFGTTPPNAFRFPGEAFFVYQAADELAVVGGVQYLERLHIKLLPIAGLLWQPTPRWEMGLVFPEPKIAYELSTPYHLWGYIAGQYGGGRWTFKSDFGPSERVDYNDLRFMAGLEWREAREWTKLPAALPSLSRTFLEIGYLFERQLRFDGRDAPFDPKPTWMIRFGSVW